MGFLKLSVFPLVLAFSCFSDKKTGLSQNYDVRSSVEEKYKMQQHTIEHPQSNQQDEDDQQAFFHQTAENRQREQNHNLLTLISVYNRDYEFPEWVIKYSKTPQYTEDCKATKIYVSGTTNDIDKDLIYKLAEEREPVNIGWSFRPYNKSDLYAYFGWKYSFYTKYYNKHKKLAPNIAVFCKTPESGNYGDGMPRINIINVIGYAFDDKNQPDYKYFKSLTAKDQEKEIKKRYYEVFEKIYQCCIDHKFKCIVFSLFGANNFAKEYWNDSKKGIRKIWLNVFNDSLKVWSSVLKANGLGQIAFCGDDGTPEELKSIIKNYGFSNIELSKKSRYVPGLWQNKYLSETLTEMKYVLIVNAWDPHSIIGNGNGGDNSIDGFVGRSTAVSALGWPLSNYYMYEENNIIRVKSK